MSDKKDDTWLRFSQFRPNGSLYFHQAATLLHSMEESLRCDICHDIFNIPVSVQPCNHSFCNDCLHKELGIDLNDGEKPPANKVLRCPTCQTRLDQSVDLGKCIVHNRNFGETARHYKTLRPLLKQALQASSQQERPAIAMKTPPPGVAASPTRDPEAVKINSKTGNYWIRDQYFIEWAEHVGTWNFRCKHCNTVASTSMKKIGNASILTQHITLRCPGASQEIKAQASENSRVKDTPKARVAKPYKGGNDSDTASDRPIEDDEKRFFRKTANPWIRDQFTVEWSDSKQTWCFVCLHCNQIATRSKDKIWNASFLTNHIAIKCTAATQEVIAEALSHTRGGKRRKRQHQRVDEDKDDDQSDALESLPPVGVQNPTDSRIV